MRLSRNHRAALDAAMMRLFHSARHWRRASERARSGRVRGDMCSNIACSFVLSFTALITIALAGCDSGWSGVHKEAGPLPLSSADKPILRLVDKRTSFEIGEETRLFWDEGNGAILAQDRIKSLQESI